jgi:hypothetical protein
MMRWRRAILCWPGVCGAALAWMVLLVGMAPDIVAAQTPAVADAQPDASCPDIQAITQARRIATRAGTELEDRSVTLPDTLALDWRNEQVTLRYEIDISACAGSSSAALSLFRVGWAKRPKNLNSQ